MQLNDTASPTAPSPAAADAPPNLGPSSSATPISELLLQPDFPHGAIGRLVDIGGFTGTILDLQRHSVRVRSAEGGTVSYNVNVLRKLYGPHIPPPAVEPTPPPTPPPVRETGPKREFIENPDFNLPLMPVEEFVTRPDFPKCAYGQNLDLHGYEGVVVEVVHRSLKVRSFQGSTRSYNADGLRKLYAKSQPPKSGASA